MNSGFGLDRQHGTRHELTDWEGNKIGSCYLASSWPVNSHVGNRMHQIYAWVDGKEYTGRGFGERMSVALRETALSLKNPQGISANGTPFHVKECVLDGFDGPKDAWCYAANHDSPSHVIKAKDGSVSINVGKRVVESRFADYLKPTFYYS